MPTRTTAEIQSQKYACSARISLLLVSCAGSAPAAGEEISCGRMTRERARGMTEIHVKKTIPSRGLPRSHEPPGHEEAQEQAEVQGAHEVAAHPVVVGPCVEERQGRGDEEPPRDPLDEPGQENDQG